MTRPRRRAKPDVYETTGNGRDRRRDLSMITPSHRRKPLDGHDDGQHRKHLNEQSHDEDPKSYREEYGDPKERADILSQIGMMREAMRGKLDIPVYPPDTTIEDLRSSRDAFERTILISQSVDANKRNLLFFFVGLEIIAKKFKVPLGSLASIQMGCMRKYEQYLISMGEKYADGKMSATGPPQDTSQKDLLMEIAMNIASVLGMNFLSPKLGEKSSKEVVEGIVSILSNYQSDDLLRRVHAVDSSRPSEADPTSTGDIPFGNFGDMAAEWLPKLIEYLPQLKTMLSTFMGGGGTKGKKPQRKKPGNFMKRKK